MPEQDVLVDRFKLGASDYIPGANSIEVIRLALDEAQGHFEREIIDLDDAAASWEIQEALAPGHRQFMRDRGCVVIDIEDAIGPKLSQRQLLDSLLAKDPIIVTLTENNEWSRHAYLLVSASLKNGKVIKYGLLDPLDGRQLYELDASEYNRRVRAEVTRAQAAEHLAAERLWVETQGLSNGVYVRNPIESKSGRYGRALIEVVRPSQLRPVYSLEVDPLELSL